jgi:hypothetical protein
MAEFAFLTSRQAHTHTHYILTSAYIDMEGRNIHIWSGVPSVEAAGEVCTPVDTPELTGAKAAW